MQARTIQAMFGAEGLLGHENIQTTMIYVQTDRARVSAAAAALPDVIGLGVSGRP